MTRLAEDLEKGIIKFVQNFLPALEAGDYTLTLKQTVASVGGKIPSEQLPTNIKKFYVRAERFRLNPSEVVTRFPPPNSQGEFATVLPHMVFQTKILPWVRTPDPDGNPQRDGVNNQNSWLALLLFDQDDPPPPPVSRSLAELVSQGRTISYYQTAPAHWEPGETSGDSCRTIDIPGSLFNQIAPSNDDLYYVASAREVFKTAAGSKGTPYSVVMGTRLPVKGHRATVHLVSLERMQPYLPDIKGRGRVTASQSVRLVSLADWSFDALDEKYSFKELMIGLDKNPATLQIPNPNPRTGKNASGALATGLAMGYTAMTHHMRQGSRTVSWYRGPLTPFDLSAREGGVAAASDKLMRYNPDTGMFDTSYAAAWQLGQLIALQNKKYAVALYDWKRELKLKSAAAEVVAQINTRFGKAFQLEGPEDLTRQNLVKQSMGFVKAVLKPYITQPPPKEPPPVLQTESFWQRFCAWFLDLLGFKKPGSGRETSARPVSELAECAGTAVGIPAETPEAEAVSHDSIRPVRPNFYDQAERLERIHQDSRVPTQIVAFRRQLALLEGVPFWYLVPHELMFPHESIRFFQLDPNWIDALLQGADSIGTNTANDQLHDRVLAPKLRAALASTPNPVSGFLLRSEVVKHWPKLVVIGQTESGVAAHLLRTSFLSDTVLLCLFDALIASVQIEEPAEGLHFGLDPDSVAANLSKTLKGVEGAEAGKQSSTKARAPAFRPGDKLVLPFHSSTSGAATLSANIKNKLVSSGIYSGTFTTAEFALEMVAGVEQVVFHHK